MSPVGQTWFTLPSSSPADGRSSEGAGASKQTAAAAAAAAAAFDAWVASPESEREAEQGAELARARREALASLAAVDAEAALALAVRPAARAALPTSVHGHIETWVTGSATIEMLCPYPRPINASAALDAYVDDAFGPAARESVGGAGADVLGRASATALMHTKLPVDHMAERAVSRAQLAESQRIRAMSTAAHNHYGARNSANVHTDAADAADHDHADHDAADHDAADHDHADHEYNYVVTFDHGPVLRASVYGNRVKRSARESVPVTGVVFGDTLAMFDSSAVVMSAEDAAVLVSESGGLVTRTATDGSDDSDDSDEAAVAAVVIGTRVFEFASDAAAGEFAAAAEAGVESEFASKFTSFTTSGDIRTVVFFVQFGDESGPATTEANYALTMSKLNEFWNVNSYGVSQYTPIEYEDIVLTGTKASYAPGGSCPIDFGKSSILDDDVWAATSKLEGDYERYLILFSEFTECPWAGLGSIAATGSWINGLFDADLHWNIAAHELGHNYGLRHANLWYGGGTSPVGSGQTLPYGDDFDIMGAVTISADRTTFHVNTHKKHGLSWIPDGDRVTAATTQRYRVFAHDAITANSGPRALRIQRGTGSNTWYWLEYRLNLDYDPARAYFQNGANVHWAYELSSFETETDLLDLTPPYNTENLYDDSINNSPLQLGRTFSDPDHQIHFTPVATSSIDGQAFLDVYVSFEAPNSAPVIQSVTASCTQPEVEEAILLIADVEDPDGDLLAYSWDFGDGSLSTSNSIAVSHGWATSGAKTVTLTVSDMRGSVVTADVAPQVVVALSGSGVCPPCPNSCSGHGICSGGVCACSPGYTAADCSQTIAITSLQPNFGPIGGGNTVTVKGVGFTSNSTSYLCNFEGLGLVPATHIDSTTLTCVAPATLSKSTIVLEVSPNGGLHYTGSQVDYTFGGGSCPNNCTGQGSCDIGPGLCTCYAGFTGDDCSTAISVSNLQPVAEGPRSGGSVVSLTVSPASGVWDLATATPMCRFGLTAPVPGTLSGTTLSCTAPPYGASDVTVFVEASPNGADYTNASLTFTYRPVIDLVEDVTSASVSLLSGQRAFFRYPLGSPTGLSVGVTLAATTGAPSMLVGSGSVPVTAGTGVTALGGPGTLTLTDADLSTGLMYATVTTSGAATDFTMLVSIAGSPNLVLGTSNPHASSAASGTPNYYTVTHSAGGAAILVEVVVTNGGAMPTLYLSGDSATPAAGTPGVISSTTGTVVVQACFAAGTYTIGVEGDAVSYTIAAREVAVPTPGTLAGREAGEIASALREESSVNVTLALASSARAYDFDLDYSVYFRRNTAVTPFATPCEIKATGTVFRQNVKFGAFGDPVIQVSPLDAATNYQVAVIVRTPDGVEASYLPVLQKTKPPPIPKALIYGLMAGSVGMALLGGFVVAFFKLRKRKRKKRKHRSGKGIRRRRKTRRGRSHTAAPAGAVGAAAGAGLPRRGKRRGGPRHAEARQERRDPAARRPATTGTSGAAAGAAAGVAVSGAPRSSRSSRSKRRRQGKQRPASAPRGQPAIARGDFVAQYATELSFTKGDRLIIIQPMESGWVKAEHMGRVGLAPASYLKVVR